MAGLLALAPFERQPVAATLEISLEEADHALGELVDYGLLLRPGDGYQVSHALAHTYARQELTPPAEVLARLAEHHAALTEAQSKLGLAGYRVLNPRRGHILAVQAAAGAAGQWDAVRPITWGARDDLDLQGGGTEQVALLQAGLAAARVAGARYDEEAFLRLLGLAYAVVGEVRRTIETESKVESTCDGGRRPPENADLIMDSVEYHEQALEISREIGDRHNETACLGNLGVAHKKLTARARELWVESLRILEAVRRWLADTK